MIFFLFIFKIISLDESVEKDRRIPMRSESKEDIAEKHCEIRITFLIRV